MTPAEAKKAAAEVLAEIQQHEEAIFALRDKYASLVRVVHGDNLHDAHNQKMIEQALERERWMNWYWSDEQKAIRAAAERAEKQPAPVEGLSADQQKAEKVLSEIEPLRQRQR